MEFIVLDAYLMICNHIQTEGFMLCNLYYNLTLKSSVAIIVLQIFVRCYSME